MARLFVIEASGKARAFQATLRELGEDAVVQFTLGHLFELPAKFDKIGVDSAFRDFERKPLKLDICEKIRAQAMLADDVVVATDADVEGDVIAWDVADLVRDFHPAPKRMRLKGMDRESVRQALADLGPVLKQDAVPGGRAPSSTASSAPPSRRRRSRSGASRRPCSGSWPRPSPGSTT